MQVKFTISGGSLPRSPIRSARFVLRRVMELKIIRVCGAEDLDITGVMVKNWNVTLDL